MKLGNPKTLAPQHLTKIEGLIVDITLWLAEGKAVILVG